MFAFKIGLAKLFYIFKFIFYYLINSGRFVVNICFKIFIIRLGIGGVRSIIEAYYFFKVNFVYSFESLKNPCVAGVTITAIPKLNL